MDICSVAVQVLPLILLEYIERDDALHPPSPA